MKRIIIVSCLLVPAVMAHAQSIERWMTGSTGAWSQAGPLNMHYSIGEVFVYTLSTSGLIMTQGFQQPNLLVTAITSTVEAESIVLYPNPSEGEFFLDLPDGITGSLEIKVYDMSGRCSASFVTGEGEAFIDLSGHAEGIYLISIVSGNREWRGKAVITGK